MRRQKIIDKAKPEIVKGKIKLPDKIVSVGVDAVESKGTPVQVDELIRRFKKAAKNEIFPRVNPS